MNDTASSGQPKDSATGNGKRLPPKAVPSMSGSAGKLPVRDDDKTVISNRPPLPSPAHPDPSGRQELGQLGPGDRLEHFELVEFVGGGGMGRVFRALDTNLSRTVALKVLPREQAADEETLARFRNEARSAAQLDHENIARVYYVGEDRGLPFLVFEFVEGSTIRHLVEEHGPLASGEAISYTLQVAEALVHAAEHSVIHRDIKPSNILITPEGRAKVIDMGLARLQTTPDADDDLTVSGVTLGTFDYISPEQARDPRVVDARSDIYSLGCTFFFMLTGRPPFPEGTVLQKLLQHQGDEPPDIHEFRPELPEDVSRVMKKMLAKDPQRRYQSPVELVEQLLLLADQVGLRPSNRVWLPPPTSRLSSLGRHLPWIVPLVALFAIVALLQLHWSPSDNEPNNLPPPLVGGPEQFVEKLPDPRDFSQKASPGSQPPLPSPDDPGTISPPGNTAGAPTIVNSGERSAKKTPLAPAAEEPGTDLAAILAFDHQGRLAPAPMAAGLSLLDQPLPGSREAPSTDLDEERSPPEPTPSPAPTATASTHHGVLVVDPTGEIPDSFPTLRSACNASSNGNVIELRYSGRREEKPVVLSNRKMTIRAAEGFLPVVTFRPDDPDPAIHPRNMLAISGGQLTMLDVALELEVPRGLRADHWSLFEVGQSGILVLESCSLTIRNASEQFEAYHEDVAFFRAESPSRSGKLGQPPASDAMPVARMELTDCMVRGEAALLRIEELQPAHLVWQNGLLAINEPAIRSEGGQRAPRPGETLRIDLQHLTALLRQGMCRLTDSRLAPYQLPTHITCIDSILIFPPETPLLEQINGTNFEQMREQVTWNGDRNFYQGPTVFWRIRHAGTDTPPVQMDFEAWKTYWGADRENLPMLGRFVETNQSEPPRPLHSHAPSDYMLDNARAENYAHGAASDGQDAGFEADLLPPLPPEKQK